MSSTTTSDGCSGADTLPTPISALEAMRVFDSIRTDTAELDNILRELRVQNDPAAVPALERDETEPGRNVYELRKQLQAQQKEHEDEMRVIELVLDDMLENGVVKQLEEQIEKAISSGIDKLVDEEVARRLAEILPDSKQAELKEQQKQLAQHRVTLHNAESKRSNTLLRDPLEPVQTLKMPNGQVSERFPATLKDFFELDADNCAALVREYEIDEGPTGSRERDLNRILQCCGVRYQMVRDGPRVRRMAAH